MLVEASGLTSDGGVRLDGLESQREYPLLSRFCWVETLAVTLAPLSRHLSFAGL